MSVRRRRVRFDAQIFAYALAGSAPGAVVAAYFLLQRAVPLKVTLTFGLLVVVSAVGFAAAIRARVTFALRTLASLLTSLREGDFSVRARKDDDGDPLGEALHEVNQLATMLRSSRLGAMEATALLEKVMSEIDVAVLAFDDHGALRLVNREGERLLARPARLALGETASTLGIATLLGARTVHAKLPGAEGTWEVRTTTFRQDGIPHTLMVLADVERALREREREAWQRIVRVLGHEIGNSLAPIASLAGSIAALLGPSAVRDEEWEADLRGGLGVIARRAEGLNRFMTAYTKVLRLPAPRPAPLAVAPWIHRVAALETRLRVRVDDGPDVDVRGDGDQLDQLLINLVKNAAEASLETGGEVRVTWRASARQVEVDVVDDGPGLAGTANLFVPFFTTKAGGSGIGLALARQIAEAHDGTLTLEDREAAKGCIARVRLPR